MDSASDESPEGGEGSASFQDLDESAICSPDRARKRARSRGPAAFLPGPGDLNEVLSINRSHVDHLLDFVPTLGYDSREKLVQLANTDVVLTSCYSGTGCCEGVVQDIWRHLQGRVGGAGKLHCYAATEINQSAQACLLGHKEPIGHVFQDILGRLSLKDKENLKQIEAEHLSAYKSLQSELALGQMDKGEFLANKQKLEAAYVGVLKEYLSDVEFMESDFCLVHQQNCFISPRRDLDHQRSLWVEASGNTCCPWSAMARAVQTGGWLDVASLPFMVWCFSVRFYEPDLILQENVCRFPEQELLAILNDFSDGVLKDLWTRPFDAEEGTQRCYKMQVHSFSPTDLGIPSNRQRQYASFSLSPWVKIETGALTFEAIFHRSRRVGPEVYLNAVPNSVLISEIKSEAKNRGWDGTKVLTQHDALSTGNRGRLESWQCWASRGTALRDKNGVWQHRLALADVTQNPRFKNRVDVDYMPCLLTHTVLWDLVTDSMVPVMAHWLAQGFPHPSAVLLSPDIARSFPFDQSLIEYGSERALPLSAQRILTGNAMHGSCIGSWFLFNMVGTDTTRIQAHMDSPVESLSSL